MKAMDPDLKFDWNPVGGYLTALKALGMEPNRMFLICAGLAFFGTGALIWRMRKMMAKEAGKEAA